MRLSYKCILTNGLIILLFNMGLVEKPWRTTEQVAHVVLMLRIGSTAFATEYLGPTQAPPVQLLIAIYLMLARNTTGSLNCFSNERKAKKPSGITHSTHESQRAALEKGRREPAGAA